MNEINLNLKDNFILKAILIFVLSTIAFYILTEHRAHLLAYSSYIFFLATFCFIFSCVEDTESMGNKDDIEGMVTKNTGITKRMKGLSRALKGIRTKPRVVKPENQLTLALSFCL